MRKEVIRSEGEWEAYAFHFSADNTKYFVRNFGLTCTVKAADESSALEILYCLARHAV